MQRKPKPVRYWYNILTGTKYLYHIMPDATGTRSLCGEKCKEREGRGFVVKNKPSKHTLFFFDAMNLPICGACMYSLWHK